MIVIHPNIIVGSVYDLTANFNNIHYILNCSISLNNLLFHPNYINLNISIFNQNSIQLLNSIFEFIYGNIELKYNIFILCETGINNSLIIGMFIIMKLYKLKYNDVYNSIVKNNIINSYYYYSGLIFYEQYILDKNNIDDMDIF